MKNKFRYGGTTVELAIDENECLYLQVRHLGNMGNRKHHVVENVRKIFNYDNNVNFVAKNEKGSPDYIYHADFYIKTQ